MSSPPLLALNDSTSGVVGQTTTAGPFQSLKPSILIIILILSMTILVSVSVCLLLRLLNRHCLRRLSPSSSTTTTTTIVASSSSNRHSGHHHHRVSPETPPQSSVLDSLPIFTFGSIKRRSSSAGSLLATSAGDCAVCLSKFEQLDQLRLLPLCCHAFHAACIDTWLESNQTCPLCRSPIQASESDILKALSVANDAGGGSAESFRLEIGSVSRRRPDSAAESRTSYSLGSFDYVVEEDSQIFMGHTHRRSVSDKEIGAPVAQPVQESSLAEEVAAGGRSWLKEYVDRLSNSLSSRAHSFRSSGRFFTGSSRQTELGSAGDYDLEANRVGEEISELFRWVSGV